MINEIQPQLEALRTQFDEIQQLRKDNGASDSDAPSFDKVLGDLISEVDVAQKHRLKKEARHHQGLRKLFLAGTSQAHVS